MTDTAINWVTDTDELDDLVEELVESPMSDPWHKDGGEAIKQLRARIVALEEVLTWLDRKGGLGLDVHEQINTVLGKKK